MCKVSPSTNKRHTSNTKPLNKNNPNRDWNHRRGKTTITLVRQDVICRNMNDYLAKVNQ